MKWDAIHRETTAVDDAEGRMHYAQNTSFSTEDEVQRRNGISSTDVPKQAGPVLNMAQCFSDYQGLVQNIGATLIGTKNPSANTDDDKDFDRAGGGVRVVIGAPPVGVAVVVGRTFYEYVDISFEFTLTKNSMGYADNPQAYFYASVTQTRLSNGATGVMTVGIYDQSSGWHFFQGKARESVGSGAPQTSSLAINDGTWYSASVKFMFTGPITGVVAAGTLSGGLLPTTRTGITIGSVTLTYANANTGFPGTTLPWSAFYYRNVAVEGR